MDYTSEFHSVDVDAWFYVAIPISLYIGAKSIGSIECFRYCQD